MSAPSRWLGRADVRLATAALSLTLSSCGAADTAPNGSGGSGGVAAPLGGYAGQAGSQQGGASAFAGSSGDAGGGGNASGAPNPGGSGGAAGASGGAGGGTAPGETFTLRSPAFDNVDGCSVETPEACEAFPAANVSYMGNANLSPELAWTAAPAGTQSFALVLFDVTYGQAHWALWNIPGTVTSLPANVAQDTATPPVPAGSRQANANFATNGGDGYFGPHMPCNVFALELYALASSSLSPMDPTSSVLVSIELQELGAEVLGVARLTGRGGPASAACE